jgi:hypothetical protein
MALPVGQSSENTPGKRGNAPGVYRHKETGKELITAPNDGGSLAEGVAQADALRQVGYEWVAEVPPAEDIRASQKKQADADKAAETKEKDPKDKETK